METFDKRKFLEWLKKYAEDIKNHELKLYNDKEYETASRASAKHTSTQRIIAEIESGRFNTNSAN